jgi:hypothetical protein
MPIQEERIGITTVEAQPNIPIVKRADSHSLVSEQLKINDDHAYPHSRLKYISGDSTATK